MPEVKGDKLPVEVKYSEPKDELLPTDGSEGFYPVKGVLRNDDISIGQRTITIKVGDDIQKAIDSIKDTGGRIRLNNGTHTPNSDLTLYSSIYIEGENADSCFIDFVDNTKSILIVGTDAYSTGTISVSTGGVAITGSGTTFTSSMVGQHILLEGLWYTIGTYVSGTSIYLTAPYVGTTLSGSTYTIATIKEDVKITDVTIKNANSGIKIQYTNESFFKDTDIQSSVIGFEAIDSAQCSIQEVDLQFNNTNFKATNCHYFGVTQTGAVGAQAGHGFQLDTVTNSFLVPLFSLSATGDGMNMTDCSNINMNGVFKNNGGQGIELVSGNSDIAIANTACENNTSDGIKLTATSDSIHFIGGTLKSNGGYGANIAASSCDNNVFIGNEVSGNATASHTDSGTGTIFRGNNGIDDNTTVTQISGTDSVASGVGDVTNTETTGFAPSIIHYMITAADANENSVSWGTWTNAPSYQTMQTEGTGLPTFQTTAAHDNTFTDGRMVITFGNVTSTGFDITYDRASATWASEAVVNYVAIK